MRWIFFTLCLAAAQGVLIPSSLEGVYALETRQVANVMIGTPPRTFKFVLDMSDRYLRIDYPLSIFSSTYRSTMIGETDVIHLGGHVIRVELGSDGGMASALGCSDCAGVLGIGPMSDLWLFAQDATFTSGAIMIGEGLEPFERLRLARKLGRFKCLPGFSELCVAKAKVYGHDNMTVYIGMNSPKTQVPVSIFDEYTAGLSVESNPNPSDWGSIHFHFYVHSGGRDNAFDLRADHIVAPSHKGGSELLLEGSGYPDVVILGTTARHSFMVKRFFLTGEAQIVDWSTETRLSWYNGIALIVMSLVLGYWTLDPPGAWILSYKNPYALVAVEGVTVVFSIFSLFAPSTWNALWAFPEVGAYAVFTVFLLIAWMLFGLVINVLHWKDLLGSVRLYLGATKTWTVSARINSPQRPSIGSDVLTVLGISPSRGPDPETVRASTHLAEYHPRVWVMTSTARVVLVGITLLVLMLETRQETLGSLGTASISLLLIFLVFHYFVITLLLPYHYRRLTFGWALYWITLVYVVVATLVIVDVYILGPLSRRFLPVPDMFAILARLIVYSLILLIAMDTGNKRVIIEEVLRYKAMEALVPTSKGKKPMNMDDYRQ